MRALRHARTPRAGFTLIELVLASALMAILMVAVFGLIEGSLSLWRKSETRRNLSEQATGVAELMSRDVRALESGERGDLLVEWESFDTDGDGLKETNWPRLRMVRLASAAEMAHLLAGEQGESADGTSAVDLTRELRLGPALIEVCWAVLPLDLKNEDARAEGLIFRGARRLDEKRRDSFFSDDFISVTGKPNTGVLDEVTGGVLWFQPLLATQTSIVHDGWVIGSDLADASTSWDAWNSARPDPTRHEWNTPGAGMPRVGKHALLPRRVRLEFEFERAVDRLRRTRTLSRIELDDVTFRVDDERQLPPADSYIKLDGEWMRVRTVRGDQVTVERATRGTRAMIHDGGSLVHWGLNLVREVKIELYREDWNL